MKVELFKFKGLTAFEWVEKFLDAYDDDEDEGAKLEALHAELGLGSPSASVLEGIIVGYAKAMWSAATVKVNDMFHICAGRLVKTSNGQPIPEDEPVFILRGRDHLAEAVIALYREKCRQYGVLPQRLEELANVINRFEEYRLSRPENMKQPGCTHGK